MAPDFLSAVDCRCAFDLDFVERCRGFRRFLFSEEILSQYYGPDAFTALETRIRIDSRFIV